MTFLLLLFCILGEICSSHHEKSSTYKPQEPIGKRFSELYGINKREREEIAEIIYQMNHPEKYPKQSIGFLLKGKSGNGKSFLAEAIAKEITGPDNRPAQIIKASGSSFINLYNGVGQTNIKRLFQAAKKNVNELCAFPRYQFHWENLLNFKNPFVFNEPRELADLTPRRTIIIIDEINAIAKRTACKTKDSEDYKVITELLYQFDELNRMKDQNIKVIGTTNDADLDEALLRSGRLETEIEIGDPNEETITEIIEHHPFLSQIEIGKLTTEIKEEYKFIPEKLIQNCLESSNQKEFIYNLVQIFFADREISFATVDIYAIFDRALTTINDERNKIPSIEVLLKLIDKIIFKKKNRGKNYFDEIKKEKENTTELYEFKGLVTKSIDALFTRCKETEKEHFKTTEALYTM
jgi:SpoVK/Ycf46/Vps4 family AAA+-type ATPase